MRTLLPLLAGVLAVPGLAAQTTFHHVPSPYPTIQAALDAAQPGEVVSVAPGVFPERLQLREDVALLGAGWRHTIVDAGRAGSPATADGVHNFHVEGITLRGSAPGTAGLEIRGSSTATFGVTSLVRRCRIVDNDLGVRVSHVHSGILTLQENVIDRNASHGVDPHLGTLLLMRNTIVGNGGDAVRLVDGAGLCYLTSNALVFNQGHGLLRTPSTPLLALHNDVFGNAQGGYAQIVSSQPIAFVPQPGTGETSLDPAFHSWQNGDYRPLLGSPLIDAGDPQIDPDLDGSAPEVGALSYDPSYVPASTSYGLGCGPEAGWFHEPILGQPYYEVHAHGGLPGAPAMLLAGTSASLWMGVPLPLDLGPVGAPGCALLVGPTLTFAHVADGAGHVVRSIVIPSSPSLAGAVLRFQWMLAEPGATPVGFVFSGGVAATIQL